MISQRFMFSMLLAGAVTTGLMASEIHIAPNGSDTAQGTAADPCATLKHAKELLRNIPRSLVMGIEEALGAGAQRAFSAAKGMDESRIVANNAPQNPGIFRPLDPLPAKTELGLDEKLKYAAIFVAFII